MSIRAALQTPLLQRLMLWCALAAFVIAAGGFQMADGRRVLQTNLLALLPQTERNPVAEMAIQRLAGVTEHQSFFLVGASDLLHASEAATQFAAVLSDSGEFSNVTLKVDASRLGMLKDWIREHRFRFMTEADITSLRQAASPEALLVQRTQRRLISPISGPQSLDFSDDPMGFAQSWLDSLPFQSMKLTPQAGVLAVHESGQAWVFVLASSRNSSYDHQAAQKVVATIDSAERSIGSAKVIRAGTVFHAEAARSKAQADVDLIGAGSLIGMLGLLYWVFRSVKPLIGAAISVLFGVLTASVLCVAVYGELHLITLVFGASLIGEAVDYAVQYFAAHLDAASEWHPLAELDRMKAGLGVALTTSLLGYAALWFSPFLGLSQIALFAMVGLFAAWLSVFLFLPWWMRQPSRTTFVGRGHLQRKWLKFWQETMTARMSLAVAALVVLISATGWAQVKGRDDVRLLIAPDAAIARQESELKALTGLDNSTQFFLIEGRDVDEVLVREEALRNLLKGNQAAGELVGYQAVSLFVPSSPNQERAVDAWGQMVFSPQTRLPSALEQAGLNNEVALQMRAQWLSQSANRLELADWLASPVSTPWRHLWLGSTQHGYASVLLPTGLKTGVSLQQVAQQVAGVVWVDKAASVGLLFHDYRLYSGLWLMGAIGLIFGLLAWRYGLRRGASILLPTILAIVFSLGAYGWSGHPLTLFNMMALMLVLGIGVNYAIFLVEGGARSATTFVGVQLSAATTLLSFGLLSLSSMPVLSGFGLNLTLGIACAVLLSPMALSLSTQEGHQP